MKVYVAGNPKYSKRKVREFMRRLESHGHVITYDWVANYTKTNYRTAAMNDRLGAIAADVLVLIDNPNGGYGMYTELGMCLANSNKYAIVVRPYYKQIFYELPNCMCVSNTGEALKLIDGLGELVAASL